MSEENKATKKMCIYHGNCADGFGAAWAMRRALGDDVEFHAGVYQQPPPNVEGKYVYLLDFSYKKDVLEEMAKTAKTITIIDHHKSAQEDLQEYIKPDFMKGFTDGDDFWFEGQCVTLGIKNIRARFNMEKSGAMMAWEYFNDGEAPELIHHIQDRDLWTFKLAGTREIQAALFSYPYDFGVWDRLMLGDPSIPVLKEEGGAIERKHFKDIRELISSAAYRMDINGYNVPVLNAPYFYSSDAGHIMGEGEPFAACYWDTPGGRTFSLRSSESGIDVSVIASAFGGGGHKNASGFTIKDFRKTTFKGTRMESLTT